MRNMQLWCEMELLLNEEDKPPWLNDLDNGLGFKGLGLWLQDEDVDWPFSLLFLYNVILW